MLSPKDTTVLREIALFRDLPSEHLAKLSDLLHHRTFPAAAGIFSEDQPGEVVYFIHSGTIKIHIEQASGEDVILNIVGAGDVLGEVAVVDGLGRSANAVTLEESVLFWMNRDDFHQCLQTMPALSYNLACLLSRRLRLASSRIQMLAALDVYGRVAHQILALAGAYAAPDAAGDLHIPIRLTQTDLAQLVGAGRVRVNQVLATYKKLKYIAMDADHRITVLNAEALSKRCR